MNKHESTIRAAALVARLRHAQADSDLLIDAAEAFSKLEEERDALSVECERWSAAATTLANKYPVDSQVFDYMDELRGTDWGKTIAARDARVKAEALEDFCMGYDSEHEMEEHVLRHLRDSADEYRKQAEESAQ